MLRIALCIGLELILLASSMASPSGLPASETARQNSNIIFPVNVPAIFIDSFYNKPCTGTSGFKGVCYSQKECKNIGGENVGTCASGLGVCCFIYKSSGEISQNGTYYVNPGFPGTYGTPGVGMVEVVPPPGTCQILLIFEQFSLAGPVEGDCNNDTFVVTGANAGSNIPILCGLNEGQHMYIDVDNTDGPIKLIVTTYDVNFAREWVVQVIFIGENDPYKAPNCCLQYHKETTGIIESFNYVARYNGMLLNNLKYSICFAYVHDYCDIGLNMDRFDIGSLTQPCGNDYVGIGPEKVCGDFIDYGLLANATGPISINVATDDNNENEEEGFSGTYTMLGC